MIFKKNWPKKSYFRPPRYFFGSFSLLFTGNAFFPCPISLIFIVISCFFLLFHSFHFIFYVCVEFSFYCVWLIVVKRRGLLLAVKVGQRLACGYRTDCQPTHINERPAQEGRIFWAAVWYRGQMQTFGTDLLLQAHMGASEETFEFFWKICSAPQLTTGHGTTKGVRAHETSGAHRPQRQCNVGRREHLVPLAVLSRQRGAVSQDVPVLKKAAVFPFFLLFFLRWKDLTKDLTLWWRLRASVEDRTGPMKPHWPLPSLT